MAIEMEPEPPITSHVYGALASLVAADHRRQGRAPPRSREIPEPREGTRHPLAAYGQRVTVRGARPRSRYRAAGTGGAYRQGGGAARPGPEGAPGPDHGHAPDRSREPLRARTRSGARGDGLRSDQLCARRPDDLGGNDRQPPARRERGGTLVPATDGHRRTTGEDGTARARTSRAESGPGPRLPRLGRTARGATPDPGGSAGRAPRGRRRHPPAPRRLPGRAAPRRPAPVQRYPEREPLPHDRR
jgi:hypothetical protein